MAAPDFGTWSQNLAMSTGAGAQNANISPWCTAPPSHPPHQSWSQGPNQMNRTLRSEQPLAPVLPPPSQYSNFPYGLAQNQYPASPSGSHASHDRQYPSMQSYPDWRFNYPSHPPRPPPSIRSSYVPGPPNPAYQNMYHGPNTSRENHHMWPQGQLPTTFGPCPMRGLPRSTAVGTSTPNLSYERGQYAGGFGGSSNAGQQSQQSDQSDPILRLTPQGPQLQQTPQIQPTRTGVIQYGGLDEARSSRDNHSQSRRSGRSSSPRTSNRRSFGDYAEDRTTSSTSSDAEEAAARSPPASRMAQRERLQWYRMSQRQDPMVTVNRQIKKFKESLERYTFDTLPGVTSRTCDICAKDYSATNVQPSEDEEIAVMLPCGHVFGEFCIDQWVREPIPMTFVN
jgi:hypothetical protein